MKFVADAKVEQYAERILSTQDVMFGSTKMNRDGELHPIPPLQVAAVLHALADYTHNKHMVTTVIDGAVLATDDFDPKVTSLGRYFHALADYIERDGVS